MCRSQRDSALAQQDLLMKKLIEVEMCGQAAARQMAALRDTVKRLHKVNTIDFDINFDSNPTPNDPF